MKVMTRVDYRNFMRLMLFVAYRKPKRIVSMVLALIIVLICGLYYTGQPLFSNPPYFPLAMAAIILIVVPALVFTRLKKYYQTNLRLQEDIEYDITTDRIKIAGSSFATETDWAKTYKIEELKNWFLIYQTRDAFNMIPKMKMTQAEINELRNILRNVTVVSKKKLK